MGDTLKSSSGRMSPEPSAATKERTSEPSSKSCAASKTPPYLFLDLRHGGGRIRWPNSGEIMADGFSIAWRVLDARGWGVPQRRRRIFLILDLDGQSAGEISFKRPGLRRNFKALRKEGKTPSSSVEGSSGEASGSVPYTLKIRSGCAGGGKGALIQEDLSATLATNNDQYLFQPLSPPPAYGFKAGQSVKARGIGWEEETSQTLGASMSGIEPTVCCPMPLQSKTIPKTAE